MKKLGLHQWQTMSRTLWWVWQMARFTSPRLLAGFLAMSVLASLLPAAMALAGRGLINAIVAGVQQGNSADSGILSWLLLGAALASSNAVISHLGDYWQQCLQDKLHQQIGLDVMAQASRLNLAQMESSETQDHIERARRYGIGSVPQVIFKMVTLLNLGLRLVTLMGILLWIEPLVVIWLGMLALPALILRWHLATQTHSLHQRRSLKYRWIDYYTRILTDLRSLPEVKLFNLAPLFIVRFRDLSDEFLIDDRRLYRFTLWVNISFALAGAVGLYSLFGRIASRIFAGALTVGDVAIYTSSAMQLQNAAEGFLQLLAGLGEQLLHLEDLRTFLDIQPISLSTGLLPLTNPLRPKDFPSGRSLGNGMVAQGKGGRDIHGTIEFVNVTFTYPNSDEPALTNLSFSLARGETVAVVGENGAGKSTLAMLLAYLYLPTAGSIRVDGADVQTLDPGVWQQQIGFVFQNFIPYEATMRENIAYGDWQYLLDHPHAVEAIAHQAQVQGLIERLPQGYETLLGWRFGKRNLSGGQWQKLALARGLARTKARLLILDEPSASLDARTEYELFSHFRQLTKDRITVLISHRFSTVSLADRILVLSKGHLIESGSHTSLLAQGGHYAMLYKLHRQSLEMGL